VVTSWPFVKRTRATFRSAEFGFFGVVVYTRVQTPRLCGQPCNAGTSLFTCWRLRGFLTNWLMVAIDPHLQIASLLLAEVGYFFKNKNND
jgi:hypothetical protein